MVGQSLWKNLKNLVLIDKKKESIKENIKSSSHLLEKDLRTIPLYKAEIESIKAKYHDAKKELNLAEMNAAELKEKEDKKRKQLESLDNSKQYPVLEKELKSIVQKRVEIDNILLSSWHKVEELGKKLTQIETEKTETIKQLEEGMQVQQQEINDLKIQLENLDKVRAEALQLIPLEWQTKYERMKNKVSDPIVPVIDSVCSACYYSVLRQDLLELKKSAVLPCRNCYRFLYYDMEEEKESQKASF